MQLLVGVAKLVLEALRVWAFSTVQSTPALRRIARTDFMSGPRCPLDEDADGLLIAITGRR